MEPYLLSTVKSDCGKKEGDLFCGTYGKNGKKFQSQPLSIKMSGNVGKDVAQELDLANPKEYPGNNYKVPQCLRTYHNPTHHCGLDPCLAVNTTHLG